VDSNIYIFGGNTKNSEACSKNMYRYNTDTNEIVQLEGTSPFVTSMTGCARVDNKIYIMGSASYDSSGRQSDTIYCFDIDTETVSVVDGVVMPKKVFKTKSVSIGSKIYTFGGIYWESSKRRYSSDVICYDTTTNEITTLSTKIPDKMWFMTSCAAIGSKVYFFGCGAYVAVSEIDEERGKYIYCFDSATETWTRLVATSPFILCGTDCCCVDNKIYLGFGATLSGLNYDLHSFDLSKSGCFELENEKVLIFPDNSGLLCNIANIAGVAINIPVGKVYRGNENNIAIEMDAYGCYGDNYKLIDPYQVV
jgi:N-acetylneuraminic acid mutarotase